MDALTTLATTKTNTIVKRLSKGRTTEDPRRYCPRCFMHLETEARALVPSLGKGGSHEPDCEHGSRHMILVCKTERRRAKRLGLDRTAC